MAIYKPSNCVPFMDSWDLRENHNLQFELNTNNTVCVGYKLKLLDSKNSVIYEGENYTTFKTPQYNGNVIEIPFIVVGAPADISNFADNVIYYVGPTETEEEKWVCKKNDAITEVTNFFNGYQNQPYKWLVSLTQGTAQRDYDMTLSSGHIVGSVPTRIQSELSEYIYKDNYIQLYDNAGNPIGSRVLIDSYDHTYGYIYPIEGSFTQASIDRAATFKIYKGSNDPEVISVSRIVKAATTAEISVWNRDSDYPYYFRSTVGASGKIDGITINVGDSILVKNQTNAAYNGVFTLQSKAGDSPSSEMVWSRSTAANTWAKITNNTFYVSNGSTVNKGKIFEAINGKDKNALGTIDETPITFREEQPVEIYPSKDDGNKTIGKIFKTNETSYDVLNVAAGTADGIKMSGVYLYANPNTEAWEPDENGDFKQTFNNNVRDIPNGYINYGGLLYSALSGCQDAGYGTSPSYFVQKNDMILVKNEENLKYNGIFVLKDIQTVVKNSSYYSSVTLIWKRYEFKDGWSGFSRSIIPMPIYDKSTAPTISTVKNYCVSAQNGTFNETNIVFEEHTDGLPKYFYKNVYVRPFIGLESGMRFNYEHDNVTGEIQNVEINTDNWYIRYVYEQGGINPPDFIPDVDTYKITSNFKTSDENPFYAFDTPEVSISISNSYGGGSGDTYDNPITISTRVINANATYNQTNNKQWVNYQWTLINSALNDYRQTDITYSGEIQCDFAGIEKNSIKSGDIFVNSYIYQLILTIEDELGNKISRTKYVKIGDDIEVTTNPFEQNVEQKFNCDLHNFEVAFGVINDVIPQNKNGEIVYEEGSMIIPDETDTFSNTTDNKTIYAAQIYEQTEVGSGTGFYSNLPIPQSDNFTLNSEHSDLSPYFEGEILRYDIFIGDNKNPKSVVITTNTDTKTDDSGITVENENRNLISVKYDELSNNYEWRTKQPIIYSMQDADYNASANYDYLDTEQAYVYETVPASQDAPVLDYLNLKWEYNSRKDGFTGSPFVSWTPEDESFGILARNAIKQKYQADGLLISVAKKENNEMNMLPSQAEAVSLKWQDKGHGCFFVNDVNAGNNHSGRQDFANQDFAFNVVVENYKDVSAVLTATMFQNGVKKDN